MAQKIVIVQGSLSPTSRTSIVIAEAVKKLDAKGVDYELIDLRKIELQFCNGKKIEEYNEEMQQIYKTMSEADGYILGMPVYQVTIAGPFKNFLDIMSKAMKYKAVGLICNSGGIRSYLAGADMLKVVSYELWTVMVQPTVHTWTGDFEDGKLKNDKAIEKIDLLVENVLRYSAVKPAIPK